MPRSPSGVNALWGPRHGGANQKVIEMLEAIDEEGLNAAQQFVDRAKEQRRHVAAHGLRTSRLQATTTRAPEGRSRSTRERRARPARRELSKLLEIAVDLERIALVGRLLRLASSLYPNIDFYSGVIFKGDRHPDQHVHGPVRDGPTAGVGSPSGSSSTPRARRSGARGRSTPVRRRGPTSDGAPLDRRASQPHPPRNRRSE